MVRFLPFLISLALSVYALFSCIQTPDEDVPHLPKLVWIVLIVFVPFIGPIVWLLMLRTQLGRRDRAVRPPKPSTRPVAPDDDPDFLKSLDRYRDPRTTAKPPQDRTPPEPEPEAEPDPPDRKPKPKPKAEDETPSESDDGKA
ncbi:phospholipase D-like protein [Kribbella steppae]|uniref:Phospholipase D-like protein n=1 Tax=Kribbella steppae TaxID=2512223 RepID=A0A4R2HW11_9ACTN|nr:PLDc N-terminal domain-containing protein [Kribbella steppae]TCO35457.1 phospholipase D-like protein [Kribbella steppae]